MAVLIGASPPIWENGWLRRWSSSYSNPEDNHSATYYVVGYAILTFVGVLATTLRFVVLYYGSIQASTKVHQRMLERILFATIRFHDTTIRGRLLVSVAYYISSPWADRNMPVAEPLRKGSRGPR